MEKKPTGTAFGTKKDALNTAPTTPGKITGELTFDDKVIQKIIGVALDSIDGLLSVDGGFFSNVAGKLINSNDVTAGIDVEVGKKQVAVDLDIVAEYGRDMGKIYDQIKDVIAREVKKMTDLDVIEVNVNVVDVKTKDQYDKESVTVQDRLSNAAESTGEFASKQTEKAKGALDKAGSSISNKAGEAKDAVGNKVDEAREPRVE